MESMGEAMWIEYQQRGRLWRCRIVAAALVDPPAQLQPEELFVTPWMKSVQAAENLALSRYFPLYEFRQGFKHPDDPTRTEFDAAPRDIVVMTGWAA